MLLKAYHGDLNNSDHASFVNLFVTMAGPFEAFLDKGYASIKTTQVVDSQASSSTTKNEKIRLNLSLLLRVDQFFSFPSDLGKKNQES